LERTQHRFPDVLLNWLQGSDKVGQEARWIIVPFIKG
jgi:hypothetical protein